MVDKTLLFGRHNNGHFKETYPDSVPVIRDYDDVYSFLVEDPESFKIKDAIALHLFGMALGKMVKDEETRIGHKLTNDQITDIIDYRIGAQPGQLLDNVLKDARKRTIDHENISNGKINKMSSNLTSKLLKIARDGLILGFSTLGCVLLILFAIKTLDVYTQHDLWQETLVFFHLKNPSDALSADGKVDSLKGVIDDLRQQVTDLEESTAAISGSPLDAKVDDLKTAIDALRQRIANPPRPPVTIKPPKPSKQKGAQTVRPGPKNHIPATG
jgi:polyhydroxyalkanoate synthesis regulator phasin